MQTLPVEPEVKEDVSASGRGPRLKMGLGPTLVAAAALAIWALICLPAALGRVTFYYRDLTELFAPTKAFGVEQLRLGRIPATNPTWALGQGFRGDPNTTAFYPDNLMYLILPFWSAFNLHLALHWLLAGFSMAMLARALAQSRAAAVMAALTYAGSGWMLSVLSFYTVTTIAAWLPLVLLAGKMGGRRGWALGGLCLGLCLLSSDPVLALGAVPLLLICVRYHGWRRGLLDAVAIAIGGCLVALPQLVATARLGPGTYRFGHGLPEASVRDFALHPARFLELLVPFPFGWPHFLGAHASWATSVMAQTPLYLSLYFGITALALALFAFRKRPEVSTLALAGLFCAWAGGVWPEALKVLSAGSFRSPEKFLVWTALALPLLAGEGLDRVTADARLRRRASFLAAIGAAIAVATALVLREPHLLPAPAAAQGRLAGSFVLAGVLLLLTAWGAWRQSATVLLASQLLALGQLAPLLMRTATSDLRAVSGAPDGGAVVATGQANPPWQPPKLAVDADDPSWEAIRNARELGPTPGVLDGRSYPAAPDAGGLHHQFYDLLLRLVARGSMSEKLAWSAELGVQTLVAAEPVSGTGAQLLGVNETGGLAAFFYRVADPAPEAWWPQTTAVAPSPYAAYKLVATQPKSATFAVLPMPKPHVPGASVELVESKPDRLVVDVSGGGGVLVVRRAFLPLWRAWAGGERLEVLPANLALLGIVVPPGRQRVVLDISSWPETAAGALGLTVALGLVLLWRHARPTSSNPAPEPFVVPSGPGLRSGREE